MFGHLYGAYRCCGWHHRKRIIVLLVWNAQEQIRVVKGRDLAVVSVAKWSNSKCDRTTFINQQMRAILLHPAEMIRIWVGQGGK